MIRFRGTRTELGNTLRRKKREFFQNYDKGNIYAYAHAEF